MNPHKTIETSQNSQATPVPRGLLLLMAVSCGMIVANLYYNQPLLADIGRAFRADAEQMGIIAMLTQIGYAAGIFLFAPLGDIREKRKWITFLLYAATAALTGMAAAQSLLWLYIASFAVGFTSVGTQLVIPFGAELAPPNERGKAVGTVMAGLLVGIVLSRIVAGYIGEQFGWRVMYGLAAVMMLVLGFTLNRRLPVKRPELQLSYPGLLTSMGRLFAEHRTLREAALTGACLFGAFSIFWTALPYFLEGPNYRMGSTVAGLFSLSGLASASFAPVIGRLADRVSPRKIVGVMLVVALSAYVCLFSAGTWMLGLIAGAILLDFGIQSAQVTNQTRVYGILPEARSRMNTVLMVTTFIGGSLGASIGGYAWSWWGWRGACIVGGCLLAAALLIWVGHRKKRVNA